MAEDRLGLRAVHVQKGCCSKHRSLLLEESVGLPLPFLADINFLQCGDCRLTNNSESIVGPSLDDFFHEYSAAVSARSSKTFLPAQGSGEHSLSDVGKVVVAGDGHDDNDADSTDDDNMEQLPHHVQLSDSVLLHLPLVDVIRARYVSKAWMSAIDAALQNPCLKAHAYIRHPCLMLLHPGSEKTGTSAVLSVFDFVHNTWLPKEILFPSNASFLVGASHGLFCFASYRDGPLKTHISSMNRDVDLFVGNPLTQTWTCLPRPLSLDGLCSRDEEGALFAFVAYDNSISPYGLSYKLLKVQRGRAANWSANFYIYDSCTSRWENHMLDVVRIQQIFYVSPGLVHCFGRHGRLLCSYNLVAQTMRTYRTRISHLVDWRHMLFGLSSVIQCAGSSFGVSRMMERREYEPPFVGMIPFVFHKWPIGIYRLGDDAKWDLASEMPSNLLKEAVEAGSDGTDFVIGSDHDRRIFLILKGSSKMVVFDVLSTEWATLPGCTYVPTFYPYKIDAFVERLV